jgi:hypothetical protein
MAARASDAKPIITFGSWPALGGTIYVVLCDFEAPEIRVLSIGASRFEARLGSDVPIQSFAVAGATTPEFFALALASGPDAQVRLFDAQLRIRATFSFPRAKAPRLRFCGSDLVMAAEGGRLTIFDTDGGTLRTV